MKGTLSINLGISRLDGTRLMKGALDNGGFGRATTFLRQDRQLDSGDFIEVDGQNGQFQGMSVIVITDARLAAPAAAFKGGVAGGKKGAAEKAGAARRAGSRKSAKKSAAKKSAAKKSAAKKSGTKKSGAGRGSAKRSAKKK